MLMHAPDADGAECPVDAGLINGHARAALENQRLVDLDTIDKVEISVQMLNSSDMRSLNHQFRDADKPTNVLSFESGMPALHDKDTGSLLVLGDVVFCPEVIATEAREQGKGCEQHWAHMIVHGTLHLCGYDHQADEEAKVMESLEIQILSRLGVPDPYQTPAEP